MSLINTAGFPKKCEAEEKRKHQLSKEKHRFPIIILSVTGQWSKFWEISIAVKAHDSAANTASDTEASVATDRHLLSTRMLCVSNHNNRDDNVL